MGGDSGTLYSIRELSGTYRGFIYTRTRQKRVYNEWKTEAKTKTKVEHGAENDGL